MPRRSYDQYCAVARALDRVGDRWTLLLVRELTEGPRRYTDLHADLPGISTDVLASRLRDMEADDLVTRRKLPAPGAAVVYTLTPHGRGLLPVLTALAAWGGPALGARRPTDAIRAHWFALPLLPLLRAAAAPRTGLVSVRTEDGSFTLRLADADAPGPTGPQDPADPPPADSGWLRPSGEADAEVALDTTTCVALAETTLTWDDGVRTGRITVDGEGPLAQALREAGTRLAVPTQAGEQLA